MVFYLTKCSNKVISRFYCFDMLIYSNFDLVLNQTPNGKSS